MRRFIQATLVLTAAGVAAGSATAMQGDPA